MKWLGIFVCIIGLSVGRCWAETAAESTGPSPLTAAGEFQAIREPLAQIFQFAIDGSQLKIDRDAWNRDGKDNGKNGAAANAAPGALQFNVGPGMNAAAAQAAINRARMMQQNGMGTPSGIESLFQRIESKVPANSRSSGGGGGNMSRDFGSEILNGRLQVNGDTIHLMFEEKQAPQRLLMFHSDGESDFRIQYIHPDGDLILLKQNGNGFSIVAILGGKVITEQGDSFLQVYRQHRQELQDVILPILAQIGINPILSPDSSDVRNAVLALAVRTPEARAEGAQLILDLDNNSFDQRERAGRLLDRKYELYRDLINDKLQEATISSEAKARLERIVAEHPESQKINGALSALKLLDDPAYLVSLLDDTDPKEAQVLTEKLEKLTGQKLGSDPAAWKDWAKKNGK